MKIRVRDRIICALSGLILVAGAAALVMEAFFGFGIAAKVHAFVVNPDLLHMAAVVAGALVLLVLGLYSIGVLFRRRNHSKNFVVQHAEAGELAISMKALESLVDRCTEKHDELHVSGVRLFNTRDGLVINLKASMATGVNIPLTISGLQKQIKQYVTSCSGVDVKEVRVQVETTAGKKAEVKGAAAVEPLATEQPVEVTVPAVEAEEAAEEEKRPLHQRLFSKADQPVNFPEPPVPPVLQPMEEPVPQPMTEIPAETVEIPAEPVEIPVEMPAAEEAAPMEEAVPAAEDAVPAEEIPLMETMAEEMPAAAVPAEEIAETPAEEPVKQKKSFFPHLFGRNKADEKTADPVEGSTDGE